MVNCNIASNFIKEYTRMCQANACKTCPLKAQLTEDETCCTDFLEHYPDKSVFVVQQWSDKHPQRTLLTEFLERYPNVEMNSDGFPENIIPCYLGLMKRKDICKNMCLYFYDKGHPCYDCWNTITKKSEETE